MMRELLNAVSQSPITCWTPAGGSSKRKQAHTVIVEPDDNPAAAEPIGFADQLPYQQYQFQDSLDGLLLSRQNSGVFLKDPNVCLMDWSADQPQQHPALRELYSSFETRGTEAPVETEVANNGGVSIIALTPDQVSQLTAAGAVSPSSEQSVQIVTSPSVSLVSMATAATAATAAPSAASAAALAERKRRPQQRRQRRRNAADSEDDEDEDDDRFDDKDGVFGGGVGDRDYRRRRERNNVAVRKSRAKTRAREQVVDQTLGQLRSCNDDLRKRVESVVRELKFLKSLMNKTKMQMPPELLTALRNYPNYFEPVE